MLMNVSPTPISPAKIHLVAGASIGTLIVYYTSGDCWQWRIATPGGEVFGHSSLYYTADAAERAGRKWIREGSWEVEE